MKKLCGLCSVAMCICILFSGVMSPVKVTLQENVSCKWVDVESWEDSSDTYNMPDPSTSSFFGDTCYASIVLVHINNNYFI